MIACGGDALIDFVPVRSADGGEAFAPRVGGSCMNVAVTLGRLGAPVTFIGGVSRDLFGEMITGEMASAGVDASRLTRSDLETTLAFVKMDGADAQYAFYDDNSAARNWLFQAEGRVLDGLDAVHVGSVTLINEPSATAYEALVAAAFDAGVFVSFDPNCRPSLVGDRVQYTARMARIARMSHLVRFSEEDLAYLYPEDDEDRIAADLLGQGAALILISRGANGATAYAASGARSIAAREVDVADTIGAGDTFHGAFLHCARECGLLAPQTLANADAATIDGLLAYATDAAAITCERIGCDPPKASELRDPRDGLAAPR